MRIYDCFLFHNELDLLELRMMELSDVVDVFVACELPVTFMMEQKPLRLDDAVIARYPALRVVHPRVYPMLPHPAIEHFQRRQLARGFSDAEPDDILLIGDADEIPHPEVLRRLRLEGMPDHPVTLMQRLYYYWVNCAEEARSWPGTVALPRRCRSEIDPEDVRENRFFFPQVAAGGWHFSWLGPVQAIQEKLRAMDVERDAAMHGTPEIVKPSSLDEEFIRACLETGGDLFGRGEMHTRKRRVPIEPGVLQPHAIGEWLARHPEYEWKAAA